MGLHLDDLNGLDVIHDLINKTVLDIDPSRTGPGKFSDQFFIWGMGYVRIFSQNLKKSFGLWFETGA